MPFWTRCAFPPTLSRCRPRVEVVGVEPEIAELTLLGVDPESYAALHEPELVGGTFLDQPDTIVLPVVVAINNHLHAGDEVTLKAGDHIVALTVAGRLKMESEGIGVGGSPFGLCAPENSSNPGRSVGAD